MTAAIRFECKKFAADLRPDYQASSVGADDALENSMLGGGEGGIRTHGTVAGTPHFECGAFDLSATSPHDKTVLAGRAGASGRGGL